MIEMLLHSHDNFAGA